MIKKAKRDQFSITVAGYKWSREVVIFGKVTEKRSTTGCPKSHCAKVRAYCSACDHLIRKISSGMFQKSSSFEEFNGFGEIDVHFFE